MLVLPMFGLVLAGCADLQDLVIRELATDHIYQREVAPYLWERFQEKMLLPAPLADPVGPAPEGLDRG